MSEGNRVCPLEGKEKCERTIKTLGMPENTGIFGSVVANWLQKCVINLLSELYEYVYFECRREICGILCIDFSKRR